MDVALFFGTAGRLRVSPFLGRRNPGERILFEVNVEESGINVNVVAACYIALSFSLLLQCSSSVTIFGISSAICVSKIVRIFFLASNSAKDIN